MHHTRGCSSSCLSFSTSTCWFRLLGNEVARHTWRPRAQPARHRWRRWCGPCPSRGMQRPPALSRRAPAPPGSQAAQALRRPPRSGNCPPCPPAPSAAGLHPLPAHRAAACLLSAQSVACMGHSDAACMRALHRQPLRVPHEQHSMCMRGESSNAPGRTSAGATCPQRAGTALARSPPRQTLRAAL